MSQKGLEECVFCVNSALKDDKSTYIIHRAEKNFVLLNLYPYTSGHLMIAPYAHVPTLSESDPAALEEMMLLAQRAEVALVNQFHQFSERHSLVGYRRLNTQR